MDKINVEVLVVVLLKIGRLDRVTRNGRVESKIFKKHCDDRLIVIAILLLLLRSRLTRFLSCLGFFGCLDNDNFADIFGRWNSGSNSFDCLTIDRW